MSEHALRLDLAHSDSTWGPTDDPTLGSELPFVMYRKDEKLGKVADFGHYMRSYVHRKTFGSGEENLDLIADGDVEASERVESEFTAVDSVKPGRASKGTRTFRPATQRYHHRQMRTPASSAREGRGEVRAKDGRRDREMRKAARAGTRKRDKLSRMKHATRRFNVARVTRTASILPLPSWSLLGRFTLSNWKQLRVSTLPRVRDYCWAGKVGEYDGKYESVSRSAPPTLRAKRSVPLPFGSVADDAVLGQMVDEGEANVVVTDAVLSQLMVAPLSVFPWDLRATVYCSKGEKGEMGKVEGIEIDARDPVRFEYHTVNETAPVPPPEGDTESRDAQYWLGVEATLIEHGFQHQCIRGAAAGKPRVRAKVMLEGGGEGEEGGGGGGGGGSASGGGGSGGGGVEEVGMGESPFAEEGGEAPTVGCRYRVFDLGSFGSGSKERIKVGVRTRVNAVIPSSVPAHGDRLLQLHALNEWNPRAPGASGESWRRKIHESPAAIFVGELKNNNFKVAKWVAQATLAGVDELKVGFVSRATPTDPTRHEILSTISASPSSLMSQLTLSQLNMWGIIKWFVRTIYEHVKDQQEAREGEGVGSEEDEEGALEAFHFVIARAPNDPIIEIHAVPKEEDLEGAAAQAVSTSATQVDRSELVKATAASAARADPKGRAGAASHAIARWIAEQAQHKDEIVPDEEEDDEDEE